jgi:Ca2+-transporting ATPase
VHIVLLELVIHPTALLVFQELAADELLAPIRRERVVRFFRYSDWAVILLTGALITIVIIWSFVRSLGVGYDVGHARTMALVALTAASAGVTVALSGLKGRLARMTVALTLLGSVTLVQVPMLSALLHFEPLHRDDWAIAAGAGFLAALIPMLRWSPWFKASSFEPRK